MRFDIVTIFPEIFQSYFAESIIKIAQAKCAIEIHIHDVRKYTKDKHKKVDDTPYGGGPGMVLMVQPFYDCVQAIPKLERRRIIMMDPAGIEYSQPMAHHYSDHYDQLILLCGRYEGFDERIYQIVDERVSIGKYVLSGGEIPAMIIIETTTRLLPGVLGDETSTKDETYSGSLDYVEYPQYTRPETFITQTGDSWSVPDILLSGNHQTIADWRKNNPKHNSQSTS